MYATDEHATGAAQLGETCRGLARAGFAYAQDLASLSVTDAVALLCARNITAVEYATAIIEKSEQHECLNGYAHFDPDKVSQSARYVGRDQAREQHEEQSPPK